MALRISSSSTLFLKIFVPIVWVTYLGSLTIAVFLNEHVSAFGLSDAQFKIALILFLILGLTILYFTLMQLLRVEVEEEAIIVTNYRKTYRYPIQNIEKISNPTSFPSIVTITLKNKGHFGKKITFIARKSVFLDYLATHPRYKELLED